MKVLLVSHNCFSKTQNMGKTFASLFSSFKKEELMQLYLYPTIPNIDICDNYFRITDMDAVRSIIKRGKCGQIIKPEVIDESETLFESVEEAEQYEKINRNSFIVRRLRDLAWKISAWKSKELKQWLKDGKPDVVFYAMGDAMFSQDIAMWVSDFLKIPLVTYVCDEFYFYYKKTNKFNLGLVSNIKKTIKKSKKLVTICDSLGEAYYREFNVPYKTVMTGSSFNIGSLPNKEKQNQISYIGGLALNRWKSLIDISDVVNELNNENLWDIKLAYYGSENEKLKGIVEYGGRLDLEGVKNTIAESKIVLHIETFDEELKERLRYSVSTKIADSLASGTLLLAYGPSDLASTIHLKENNCAPVVSDKLELKKVLKELLKDNKLKEEYETNAINTAMKFHDTKINSEKIRNILLNL